MEASPFGLHLTKSPSVVDVVQKILPPSGCVSCSTSFGCSESGSRHGLNPLASWCSSNKTEPTKFSVSLLRIGNWEVRTSVGDNMVGVLDRSCGPSIHSSQFVVHSCILSYSIVQIFSAYGLHNCSFSASYMTLVPFCETVDYCEPSCVTYLHFLDFNRYKSEGFIVEHIVS